MTEKSNFNFLSVEELVVTQDFENELKQLNNSRCFFPIYKAPLGEDHLKTLPKALRTQALTALTSNFGFVGLVQYAW